MIRRLFPALAAITVALAVLAAPAAAEDDPATVDDPVSTTTIAQLPPVQTTTTTIELSAPTTVATPPTVPPTVPPVVTTVPTQVLGTVETNDGELAHTGVEAEALAALGVGLIAAGSLLGRRSRSSR